MAMLGSFGGTRRTAKSLGGGAERDLTEFVCPVCLEIFDSPMTTECGHTFCNRCLQECLRPKKPVCAVCRAALDKWGRAIDLEDVIHRTPKPCKGCGQEIVLSEMRAHMGSCTKYQDYVQEGLKNISHAQPDAVSSVPNRYTFTCPYCSRPNFDQDGLVEHCNSQHARDPRQVVSSVPRLHPEREFRVGILWKSQCWFFFLTRLLACYLLSISVMMRVCNLSSLHSRMSSVSS